MTDVILYHFTTLENVHSIRAHGFTPKPLSLHGTTGALPFVVSLTSNPDPKCLIGKSLTDGSPLKGLNLAAYRKSVGDPTAAPPFTLRTCECRMRLAIPQTDPLLKKLDNFAQSHGVTDAALDHFMNLGGGHRNSWWIYEGSIPQKYVISVNRDYKRYDEIV